MQNSEKESPTIKKINQRGGRRPGAGRPLGVQNKITRPLRELAALHSADCIAVLVHLRDHAEVEQVRLAAASALLDRGHGRPRQEIELGSDNKLIVVVDRIPAQLVTALPEPDAPHVVNHQLLPDLSIDGSETDEHAS